MQTINYRIYGDNDILLYKKQQGYEIHITDFSFVHNDVKYNVRINSPGCFGKWYVFLMDGMTIMSNNVWLHGTSANHKKSEEWILQREVSKKPDTENIVIADINLLSPERQQKLKSYVLKCINDDN